MALFVSAVSAPIVVFVPRELAKGNRLALIGFLFPLVAFGLIVAAIRATAVVMRFGGSFLIADALPVPLGGTLSGHVLVPKASDALTSARTITARLTCYVQDRSGTDNWESIVCQNEASIDGNALQRTARGVAIPIAIDVPREGLTTENRHRYWKLNVDADVPGVDYKATFEVPVLGESEAPAQPAAAPTAPPQMSVIERRTENGLEIDFPAFRTPGPAFGLLLFTAIWIGAILLMRAVHAPLIFPLISGLFALLFVYILLDLFFGSSAIRIGAERIHVRSSLLFFRSERDIARSDVADVRLKIGMQSSGKPYYDVIIALTNGRRVTAGKYLANKREAEWIAAQIKAS